MIQSFILGALIILCVLLLISIIRKPFESRVQNPCRFKILAPKYTITDNKKHACFSIIVEKQHKYFINFPLLFRFYSDSKFKTDVKIFYSTPGEKRQMVLDNQVEYLSKTKEFTVYVTEVIVGRLLIEVELEVDHGIPIIGFEIMQNSTCRLTKEHRIELKFPE